MSDDEELQGSESHQSEQQVMGVDAYASKRDQLRNDFAPYIYEQRIIEDAIQIYIEVMGDDISKGNPRRAMMAKCAHEAYKRNNIHKDPVLLFSKFGIEQKKFTDACQLFYQKLFQAGRLGEFPKMHLTAKQLLKDIGHNLNVSDLPYEELGKLIDRMYDNSEFLGRWAPRDVAISVVFWYMNKEATSLKVMSKDELKAKTKIAESKINLMMAAIEKIQKPT